MTLSSTTMKETMVNNNDKYIYAYIVLGRLDSGQLHPHGRMAKEARVCHKSTEVICGTVWGVLGSAIPQDGVFHGLHI